MIEGGRAHRTYSAALCAITALVFLAHMYIIALPDKEACFSEGDMAYRCIMDEYYYIPWAKAMASGSQCFIAVGPCHLEHPPLGVALIALGIALFGDDALGWRFFSVLLGTMGVPLLYLLALRLSGRHSFALWSALLLSLETLYFVHSSAALLDVQPTFFLMLSLLLLCRKRYSLAGVALGLAGLSKETAAFGAAALATYMLLADGSPRGQRALRLAKVVSLSLAIFFLGLQLFDIFYARFVFQSFLDHVKYMLSYGISLKGQGWYDPLLGRPITPFDWLLAYSPVGYYISRVTVDGLSIVDVGYYGTLNMAIAWSTLVWLPLAMYDIVRQRPHLLQGQAPWASTLPLLCAVWFLWGYVPYIVLYALGRVTYPFYILPAVPEMCMGAAYAIDRLRFPRWARSSYFVMAFLWFLLFYPHKAFLPLALRAFLRF